MSKVYSHKVFMKNILMSLEESTKLLAESENIIDQSKYRIERFQAENRQKIA